MHAHTHSARTHKKSPYRWGSQIQWRKTVVFPNGLSLKYGMDFHRSL